jgi:hypothetical protein
MRNVIRAILVVLVVSAGCAAPVAAGPFEDGLAAYDHGDYATALRLLRPLAEQGHAESQIRLALIYNYGFGVAQNDTEAVRWYQLAAEQGNTTAQYYLGIIYEFGQGVPRDYSEAVKWFRLAAEQGYARAQVGLGFIYEHGRGVLLDYVQAHRWYDLASTHYSASENEDRARAVRNRDAVAAKM